MRSPELVEGRSMAEREGFEPGFHLEAKSQENADLIND